LINNTATTGQIALGATGQTGTITIGQSTDSNNINIGNAVTDSAKTQNINIGNATGSGGSANINIGASGTGTNIIKIGLYGAENVSVLIGGDKLAFFQKTTAVTRGTSDGTLATLITILKNYGLIA